ncbi:GGDEF/EAL domain-containing response regulator [Teredinibacter haidensis]|uniref:GGDEF/EAL domain-containing response regulator n=1 Tax=Teredinibacter haidensis TaxID=2731755 RepID=UPI0009489453|nr:EAL domain-containing protein [Teredinibacter haidensis]
MANDNDNSSEMMEFLDDKPSSESEAPKVKSSVWRILITDDEQDVHTATTFALRNTRILGRKIEFLHAKSARETIEILKKYKDIAVIMLDVVMETPNAGLDLVAVIREELNVTDSRIILRTGQPNQAPEIEVIRDYDINDYKLKSELTQSKLYAALTTAVRSYKQIRMIEAGKKGLDMIVRSSADLLNKNGLHAFAQGVIIHLSGLLSVPPEGLICVRRNDKRREGQPEIIAAAGQYCNLIDRPLADLEEVHARTLLESSLDTRSNVYDQYGLALYLGSNARGDMSCYVSSATQLDEIDQSLLELFCTNISICADNLTLLEQLSDSAYIDELVGLPNRNALIKSIEQTLESQSPSGYLLAIADIDNFAEINASLGQKYGDRLLQAVAKRMRKYFPEPCVVARIAGDTFAVFAKDTYLKADNILEPFSTPFDISGEEQMISVTAGMVPLEKVDGGASEAVKDASIVLKQAKTRNRGDMCRFDSVMVEQAKDRLELLKNLRTAFDMERLILHYQPKLCLKTERVLGVEALLRWPVEGGEFVPPGHFIPLAEQSGLIVRLGEWILRTALMELHVLDHHGWHDIHMSVNLSVAQLQHPAMIQTLKRVLAETEVKPEMVDLEVTESIAMDDACYNNKMLNEIKTLGFQLSLDDFGTGFSSLSQLQKIPIDRLKIDQSFVQAFEDQHSRDIVELIVHLGRKLNKKVIAEGAETKEQVDFLKSLECDEVQGFYFARPMSADKLHLWLKEREH